MSWSSTYHRGLLLRLAGLTLLVAVLLGYWAHAAWGVGTPVEHVLVWAIPADVDAGLLGDAKVIVDLGERLLVEVDPRNLADPSRCPIADPQPFTQPTFLASAPAERLEPLPAGIAHRSRGPGSWWLLRGTREAIEVLAQRGVSLVALSPDAPPIERQMAGRPGGPDRLPAAPSSAVFEIVDLIDQAEITATLQRLQDFGSRYAYADSNAAATTYLADRFASFGLEVELDPFYMNGKWVNNVVATHFGTERPDEVYIVCGHFDSISQLPWSDAPGADDNGSGSTAVVELARVMANRPFESTIQFICFNGEEQGLVGSEHYVEDVVIPTNLDVRGVINLDMIAYVAPAYPLWDVNVYSDLLVSSDLGVHFARCVGDYTSCTDYLVQTTEPTYGSDHFWFAQHGYPAVFGIDAQLWGAGDWNPYYHSPQDRIETLDLAYLTDFARAAAAAVAELAVPLPPMAVAGPAIAAARPELRVGPNPGRGMTTLSWSGGPGTVSIVDVLGRRIASHTGNGSWVWDGTLPASRQRVAGGIYWAVLETAGGTVTTRLVRLR